MTTSEKKLTAVGGLPLWVSGLVPLVALTLMLAVFAFGNPLSMFRANLPPIIADLERIAVTPSGLKRTSSTGDPIL
jgi:hypothetical protein